MTESKSLYERVGGSDAIGQLVGGFYARVLADHELRSFFDGVSVDKLKRMQEAFFAAALDGPQLPGDIDLARIHHGMGISRRHLTRFADHLISELGTHSKISPKDAMAIIFQIGTYSDQILEDPGGTDG